MIIFNDIDLIIDPWLGVEDIGQRPHYTHRASFNRMLRRPEREMNGRELAVKILKKMEDNWSTAMQDRSSRLPSENNWRFEKFPEFDAENVKPETLLERAIVRLADNTWANQIPVASGMGDAEGRRCCIDLARLLNSELWLYELKWPPSDTRPPSDTPLSTAVQMLLYGLLYLFWRKHREELVRNWPEGQRSPKMLSAEIVHLRTLAPALFYKSDKPGSLEWLEAVLSDGVAAVAWQQKIVMDFRFDVFKDPFFESLYR